MIDFNSKLVIRKDRELSIREHIDKKKKRN